MSAGLSPIMLEGRFVRAQSHVVRHVRMLAPDLDHGKFEVLEHIKVSVVHIQEGCCLTINRVTRNPLLQPVRRGMHVEQRQRE